jgi:hypothetical protein
MVDGPPGGPWAAALVRAPDASTADLDLEPYQVETGRPFWVSITYDDGSTSGFWVQGGAADPNLRMPAPTTAPVDAGAPTVSGSSGSAPAPTILPGIPLIALAPTGPLPLTAGKPAWGHPRAFRATSWRDTATLGRAHPARTKHPDRPPIVARLHPAEVHRSRGHRPRDRGFTAR